MHSWGDEGVDWEGINDAAYYIAHTLKTWVRLPVQDYKEKFGTVRVYCGWGWYGIYGIWRPSHCWYPKWWPTRLDHWLANTWMWKQLNKAVIKIQQKAYAHVYKRAVQKWPHLYKEIISSADYGELFEGVVPGYKHSDFWRTLEDYNGDGECEIYEETDLDAGEDAGERADLERAKQRDEGSTPEDYKDIDKW